MTVSIDSIPGAHSVAKADRKVLVRTYVPARHPKILQRTSEYGQMAKKLQAGDRVTWNTSQGKTSGTVQKKLTGASDIKGHHVAASRDNPEYLMKSEKSGKPAAHKADALKKQK